MSGAPEAANRRTGAPPRVVLVSMPFASFRQPSAALGLLKAELERPTAETRAGDGSAEVVVVDAALRFAELISPEAYDAIATWRVEDLLGDWVFSPALSRGGRRSVAEYERDVLAGGLPQHSVPHFGKPPVTDAFRRAIAAARERVDAFLDELVEEIGSSDPLVVGLTSMVHQHAASLALAERVKAAFPATFVVMGGPSCRGEMGVETLRSFPAVDAIATGDGEGVLPALVRRLSGDDAAEPGTADKTRVGPAAIDGRSSAQEAVPGLLTRADLDDAGGRPLTPYEPEPADLDELPLPDYGDYFERLARSPLGGVFSPRLPIEASRGCWWGEKRRCAFCGQASDSLAYREKSPSRVLDEMERLLGHHPGCPVLFTDEIVPGTVIEQVAPLLPARLPGLRVLYFETRPGLSREHLAALAAAGIRRLEVGIESLSTPSLRLMRKGTTARQGVELLKWARELGVEIVWNLLWGLPGEDPAWNEEMARLVPSLSHLQPPNAVGAVRLDRFSPLFEEREAWGIEDVRPYPAYGYVYDLPDEALARLAAHFTFSVRDLATGEAGGGAAGDEHGGGAAADRQARGGGRIERERDGQTGAPARDARAVAATALLADRVDAWKRSYPKALLWWSDDGRELTISDSRPGFDTEQLTVLDGEHRLLYLACDAARPAAELAADLTAAGSGAPLEAADVQELAAPLVEQGFLLRDGDAYLGLALRAPER